MFWICRPCVGRERVSLLYHTFVWNKNMMGVDNDRHAKIINMAINSQHMDGMVRMYVISAKFQLFIKCTSNVKQRQKRKKSTERKSKRFAFHFMTDNATRGNCSCKHQSQYKRAQQQLNCRPKAVNRSPRMIWNKYTIPFHSFYSSSSSASSSERWWANINGDHLEAAKMEEISST